jgi:hypothetical protein
VGKELIDDFKRVNIPLAVGSYEAMDQSFAFNDTNIDLDPDLMHIRFVLCHEGVNANGDTFTKEVLQDAQFTPRTKPVDWEHGQPIVGTIVDSKYGEDANGRGYIEAIGVVWKFLYPELSGDIKSKAASGDLKLSMECYYKNANYKLGDMVYDQETSTKMGLTQYVGREYLGQRVERVFTNVIFGGVGVVANPADKEAVFLSVARDLNSHNIGIEVDVNDKEAIANIAKTIAEAINRNVNDFSVKTHSKEVNHAIIVAKYVKAFDKAKSSIVSKFNKDELKAKVQIVSEVRNVLDTFLTEVATISNSYSKETASDETDIETAISQDLFYEDIRSMLSTELYNHYLKFNESIEAYLLKVSEVYFIYELVDYSQSFPNSVRLFKGFYSNIDGQISIDYEKTVEVEQVYVEKGSINIEEVQDTMSKELEKDTIEAEEVEAKKKNKDDGDPEDKLDNGDDEDIEDKKGAPMKKKKASEYDEEIATLVAKLASKDADFISLEAKFTALESKFAGIESDKLVATRLADLKEEGIEFSESRLDKEIAKLRVMSNEDYADHKELLVEVAGKKVIAKEAEELDEAEASEEEVLDEEITVETVKASRVLNMESESNKDVKPFGHLHG